MTFNITTEDSEWSYSINFAPIDPDDLTVNRLKLINQSDFKSISMPSAPFSSVSYTTYNPARGTASAGGVNLTSSNYATSVKVSTLGRSRICITDRYESFGGYSGC